MDKEILENHTYALALLNKLGINLLEIKEQEEALRILREDIQFNAKGVFVPYLNYYYSDYDEAVTGLLELALEEYKFFKNERLIVPMFQGKLEFKRKPHLENLSNGYIIPCTAEQAETINNLRIDLA